MCLNILVVWAMKRVHGQPEGSQRRADSYATESLLVAFGSRVQCSCFKDGVPLNKVGVGDLPLHPKFKDFRAQLLVTPCDASASTTCNPSKAYDIAF